jgi:hypothetical protein
VESFVIPDYRWKLVYFDGWAEDGSARLLEFTDADGEPWESPEIGLILVLQPGFVYDILRDVNNYLYDEELGRWVNFDDRGFFDQLTRNIRHYSCFRNGWWIPDRDKWTPIHKRYAIEVRGK